jgi:peptidoglycan/LPS O-acetylase OafA/YrhL
MVSSNRRIDFLDAIRGLAALTVVCSHFVLAYGLPHWKWLLTSTPLHCWWDGSAAVSMFFVLSGLVLSLRYFRSADEPFISAADVVRFGWSRFARICLPYFVALLVIAACNLAAPRISRTFGANQWTELAISAGPTHVAKEAMLFVISGSGERYTVIPQAWSLSVELVISVLVPFGVMLASRRVWWLAAATFALLLGGLSLFAFHFTLGIVIGKFFDCLRESRIGIAAWALLIASGLLLYTAGPTFHLRFGKMWVTTGLGAAMIICACTASPRLSRGLSVLPLRYLGRVSYGVYLLHFAILALLGPIVYRACGSFHPWIMTLAFVIAASIAVAEPFYRFVECPSITFGKRVIGFRINTALPDQWPVPSRQIRAAA